MMLSILDLDLPTQFNILKHLSAGDLSRFQRASKEAYSVGGDKSLWTPLFKKKSDFVSTREYNEPIPVPTHPRKHYMNIHWLMSLRSGHRASECKKSRYLAELFFKTPCIYELHLNTPGLFPIHASYGIMDIFEAHPDLLLPTFRGEHFRTTLLTALKDSDPHAPFEQGAQKLELAPHIKALIDEGLCAELKLEYGPTRNHLNLSYRRLGLKLRFNSDLYYEQEDTCEGDSSTYSEEGYDSSHSFDY